MSRAVESKNCEACGQVFRKDPRYGQPYWGRQKYCSRECAGAANRKRLAEQRPDFLEDFNKCFIPDPNGCWPWIWLTDKSGYGLFNYKRKNYRAARLALELNGVEIPKGQYACHHCDNPLCVRPNHLYAGTPKENSKDAIKRDRICRGERRSKKLTDADVLSIRTSKETHVALAAKYGVSRPTISMICARKTWRHLP